MALYLLRTKEFTLYRPVKSEQEKLDANGIADIGMHGWIEVEASASTQRTFLRRDTIVAVHVFSEEEGEQSLRA